MSQQAQQVTADHGDLTQVALQINGTLTTFEQAAKKVWLQFSTWGSQLQLNPNDAAVLFKEHSRKTRTGITQLISLFEKTVLKPKLPTTLRPREKQRITSAITAMEGWIWTGAKGLLQSIHKDCGSKVLSSRSPEDQKFFVYKWLDEIRSGAEQLIRTIRGSVVEDLQTTDELMVPSNFKLGRFNVIDQYGLHEKSVGKWLDAVRKASSILHSKGFDYLLYGDLILTESNNWSGLYSFDDDTVYLALDKGSPGVEGSMVNTFVHELGHRLWFKFMDSGQRDTFAGPWLDQEGIIREVYEKVNEMMVVEPQEREEAFRVIRDSRYDFKTFKKWIEHSPERKLRWMVLLSGCYLSAALTPLDDKGQVLNKEAFDTLRDRIVEREEEIALYEKLQSGKITPESMGWPADEVEHAPQMIEQNRRTIERIFNETHEGLTFQPVHLYSLDEIREVYEPGSAYPRSPKDRVIQDVLKLSPIEPSITKYGQTNRKEDFAETFEEVIMGREKRHEVVLKLQHAVPKGIVASVDDILRANGYRALAEQLEVTSYASPAMMNAVANFASMFRQAKLQTRQGERPDVLTFHWEEDGRDRLVEISNTQVEIDLGGRIQKWPLAKWTQALNFMRGHLGLAVPKKKPGLLHQLMPQFAEMDSGFFAVIPNVPLTPTKDSRPEPMKASTDMNRLHPTVRKEIIATMLRAGRPDLANKLSRLAARPVTAKTVTSIWAPHSRDIQRLDYFRDQMTNGLKQMETSFSVLDGPGIGDDDDGSDMADAARSVDKLAQALVKQATSFAKIAHEMMLFVTEED